MGKFVLCSVYLQNLYFLKDREEGNAILKVLLPNKTKGFILSIQDYLFGILCKYIFLCSRLGIKY